MRVIVTRVQPQADAWVEKLVARGHDAVALPLMEVRALSDVSRVRAAGRQWCSYSAVMFVSSHAVDYFFRENGALALIFKADEAIKTRVWATGPGTRRALLKHGVPASFLDVPPADAGQFDSEALWQVVGRQVKPGNRVLIVRGGSDAAGNTTQDSGQGVGRDWLAQTLMQAGAVVEFVVAYERGAPNWLPEQLALAHEASLDGSVWLFSSAESLVHLRSLMPAMDWSASRAVATHPRIAVAATALGFGWVKQSKPVVEDVVSSIESMI